MSSFELAMALPDGCGESDSGDAFGLALGRGRRPIIPAASSSQTRPSPPRGWPHSRASAAYGHHVGDTYCRRLYLICNSCASPRNSKFILQETLDKFRRAVTVAREN